MPNAAPNRPTMFIVADRRAAVTGVESVNGKQGEVTLVASDIPNSVLTVNGNKPDTNGNISISTGDDANVLYIGEIMHVPATHTPSGALPCDGTLYNRTTYPDLWAQIADGTLQAVADSVWMDGDFAKFSYGTQDDGTDGTVDKGTNFRVPDLTGRIQQLDFVKLTDVDNIDQYYADQVGMYYQNTPSLAKVSMGYPVEGLCGTLVVYGNGYAPVTDDTKQGANQVYYPADSDHPYTRVWTPAPDTSTAGKWSDWDQVNIASDGLWLSGKNKNFEIKVDGQFSVEPNMNTIATEDSFYIQRQKDENGATFYQYGIQGGTNTFPYFKMTADGSVGIHADMATGSALNLYAGAGMSLNANADVHFNINDNQNVWNNSMYISTNAEEGFQKAPQGWVAESGDSGNGANIGIVTFGPNTDNWCREDFYLKNLYYWAKRIIVSTGGANNIWEFRSDGSLYAPGNITAHGNVYANDSSTPLTTVQHVEEVHDKLMARIEALEARLARYEAQ